MWALTYDYLISYSMEDMSPEPGAGHRVGDLRRRAHLDLHDPRRRDVVRRRAADRRATSPTPSTGSSTAAPRRRPGRRTSIGVESVEAPDDTTVVLTLKKPNAVAAAAADPDRARARLEGRPRERGQELRQRARATASRSSGSGPFRLVEGTAGGSTYRFEANPDYWKGAPHIDEVVFRVYKSEDPTVQALIKGEVDFVEGISALQVQSLEGQRGHHRPQRRLAGLRRDRLQHRLDRHRDRRADGRPQPGRARPGVPLRARLRHRPRADHPHGLPGRRPARARRSSRRPTPATTGSRPRTTTPSPTTPSKAAELLDEAGYTVGDDGFRTLPDGDPIGTLRLARAQRLARPRVDVMDFFQEWLADIDIDSEVEAYESSKLTDVILEGDVRHLRVGLVRRARPRLDAQLHDLRPARQLVGLVVLQRGVRRALRAAARRDGRRGPGRDRSSRCRRSSTATRPTW